MNSAARSLRARRKLLHVAVMALNFTHDRAPLSYLMWQQLPGVDGKVFNLMHVYMSSSILTTSSTCLLWNPTSTSLTSGLQSIYVLTFAQMIHMRSLG